MASQKNRHLGSVSNANQREEDGGSVVERDLDGTLLQ
jgi:hypothetical protein